MEGILIPIVGVMASMGLGCLCLVTPPFRRFTLAAFVSPFAASLVLWFGALIFMDMNPAAEYGLAQANGHDHDPTAFDYALLWAGTASTLIVSAGVSYGAQAVVKELFFTRHKVASILRTTTEDRRRSDMPSTRRSDTS